MKKIKGILRQVFNKKSFRIPKNNKLSEAELNDMKSTIVEIELRDR